MDDGAAEADGLPALVGVGLVFERGSGNSRQSWICSEVRPYVRKDGVRSALAVWSGHCRVCGADVEVITQARRIVLWNMTRTCPDHRKVKP